MTQQNTRYKLPLNKRVRLRGDCTDVYTLARAGAEGWIRARQIDPVGFFAMVRIEWDREHWSYNGQHDMWTFEDHFELVEEEQLMSKKPTKEELAAALTVIQGALTDEDERTPPQGDLSPVEEQRENPDAEYKRIVREAFRYITDNAGAFVVVAVGREDSPFDEGRTVLVPRVFKAERSEDAGVLVGPPLAEMAHFLHSELAIEKVKDLINPQPPQAA